MPTLNGICHRNFNELAADAFDILDGFESVLTMSNAGPELPLEIHRRWPNMLQISRLYRPEGDLLTPEDFVAEFSPQIKAIIPACKLFQILNEPDLSHKQISPEDFAAWFVKVYWLLKKLYPDCEFGFPMPSIQGEVAWAYALRCECGIRHADFLAERGYWQGSGTAMMRDPLWGSRYKLTHQQWPTKAIHLCEYGNSADIRDVPGLEKARQYREFVGALPDYVSSAHAFIMSYNTSAPSDPANSHQRLWIDKGMARIMLGNGNVQPTPEPAPQPDPSVPHEGRPMTREEQDQAFADYKTALDAYPMFSKVRAMQPMLGDPIGPERDYGGTRLQFCTGGIIGCEIGSWEKAWYVLAPKKADDLPVV